MGPYVDKDRSLILDELKEHSEIIFDAETPQVLELPPDNLWVRNVGSKGSFLNTSSLSQKRFAVSGLLATLFLKALLNDELKATSIIQ